MLSGENNPFEAISGIWKWRSEEQPERDEFMRIGRDGRVVSFVYIYPEKDLKHPIRNGVTRIEGDEYEVRLAPGNEGWRVKIHMTDVGLRIVSSSREHDLTSAPKSEVPDWFEPMLEDALARMTDEEESQLSSDQPFENT